MQATHGDIRRSMGDQIALRLSPSLRSRIAIADSVSEYSVYLFAFFFTIFIIAVPSFASCLCASLVFVLPVWSWKLHVGRFLQFVLKAAVAPTNFKECVFHLALPVLHYRLRVQYFAMGVGPPCSPELQIQAML